MKRKGLFFIAIAGLAVVTLLAQQAPAPLLNESLLNGLTYRNMGPYRAGAWCVGVAVPEAPARAHRNTIYAAMRTGGVWKSSNGGVTFEPIMDSQSIYSMGAIAVAPSNENVVWVGTGDNSATRSAYWGDGVYKSTDGGRTWQNMGLKETHHIARIVVHPTRPDTVYVAALGHLATPNDERGVFKTTDGGKSWKKVHFVNNRTGAVDLVRDPRNPEVLYVATYEVERLAWVINDGGPGTGIYKTTDGGANWTELTNGLPKGPMGRIGMDICRSNPNVLYAVYDNHNLRPNPRNDIDTINGQVYRTDDAGASWRKVSPDGVDPSGKAAYSFNQLTADPNNPDRIWITGSSYNYSTDGGKTWPNLQPGISGPRIFGRAFGDFRSLWVDPEDSDRMIATSDGGVFQSFDGGRTCEHYQTIRGGEVYALGVDMDTPYNIYAGLQDHESWKGPSNGWAGNIGIDDWVTVGTGDGMYNQVDPTDSRWVYNTQEFGGLGRYDQKTHERIRIAPTRPQPDPKLQGAQAKPQLPPLRINWIAPFILSPHDPKTIYAGAQVVFKSTDRGDHWQEISPDLTNNDPNKINKGQSGSNIVYCDISTLSESPIIRGLLWIGTDDGKTWVTRNDGLDWTEVTKSIAAAGGPEDVWVSRVYASRFAAGTAYVAKTGRRQDIFKPYLFKTTDFGATWKNISANLPQWPVNSILEDLQNPSVLFAGTDIGVYVSINGGARWVALKSNMAPAPVTDMVIHPREQDLVTGTYGRGIWVVDVAPIREMTEENLAKAAHLFAVKPKPIRRDGAQGNYRLLGDTFPSTPNEPNGLLIYYYLKQDAAQPVSITIADQTGKVVRTLSGPQRAGINRMSSEGGGGFGGGGGGGRGGQAAAAMPPGEYVVTLTLGDTKLTQKARIMPTPEFR
jgi:photosystem II stability/assembly factor-like uncharacterized protein